MFGTLENEVKPHTTATKLGQLKKNSFGTTLHLWQDILSFMYNQICFTEFKK